MEELEKSLNEISSFDRAFHFEEGSAQRTVQQRAPFELDRYLAIKASELAVG